MKPGISVGLLFIYLIFIYDGKVMNPFPGFILQTDGNANVSVADNSGRKSFESLYGLILE